MHVPVGWAPSPVLSEPGEPTAEPRALGATLTTLARTGEDAYPTSVQVSAIDDPGTSARAGVGSIYEKTVSLRRGDADPSSGISFLDQR